MKSSIVGHRVVHEIGASANWNGAGAALPGAKVRSYPSENDFLSAGSAKAGDCVIVHARWPVIEILDFIDRLRPAERGISCLLATRNGFVGEFVRAVRAGSVDVVDASQDVVRVLAQMERRRRSERRQARSPLVVRETSRQKSAALEGIHHSGLGREPRPASELVGNLTPRERSVLLLLAAGKSKRAIALHLHRQVKTVESHCASIRRKLHAASGREVVRIAKQLRLSEAGANAGD